MKTKLLKTVRIEMLEGRRLMSAVSKFEYSTENILDADSRAVEIPSLQATSIHFTLKNAPRGMAIGATTGAITWSPTESQVGNYAITVFGKTATGTTDEPLIFQVQPSSGAFTFSDEAINAFEKSLHYVNSLINGYEHQVTWRLDNHSQVTGPNGIDESNGTVIISETAGAQLEYTSTINSLTSQLSLQVAGALGSTELSFAAGTPLSAVVDAINSTSSATGVDAAVSGIALKFNPATSGRNQLLTISASNGTFNTTVSTPQAAIAETIANGFTTIENYLSSDWTEPDVVLSSAQIATIAEQRQALNAVQARFQVFAASRYASDQAKNSH